MKMRLIVAGSRTVTHWMFVEQAINEFLEEMYTDEYDQLIIISGTAKGVDRLGERYADEYNEDCHFYPAKWEEFGKRAGFMRNIEMAEVATHCLVICENDSRGALHMFETAKSHGLITKLVDY